MKKCYAIRLKSNRSEIKPKPRTEKSIMLGIMQALGMKGWIVVRMPPSIYSKKGIPDLYVIKDGFHAWIEVKSEKGKLSDEQRRFGDMIDMAGGHYIVARTEDYAINTLEMLKESAFT
uniref:Putative holliday junction resolvase n=1 Tax=viral metagenome TaxID=1070528 RepID=A0A6M3JPH4_9ZZZZ